MRPLLFSFKRSLVYRYIKKNQISNLNNEFFFIESVFSIPSGIVSGLRKYAQNFKVHVVLMVLLNIQPPGNDFTLMRLFRLSFFISYCKSLIQFLLMNHGLDFAVGVLMSAAPFTNLKFDCSVI